MHTSSPHRSTMPPKPSSQRRWQDGDIAFLKTCAAFSPRDYSDLVASGYIHEKATCHPVIILKSNPASDTAIITPVTAFSSGPENNFQPPWHQICHRRKCPDDFRAFLGTERPNNIHAALRLADPDMKMPKPRASWVYIGHFWTVPFSVLGRFNKTPSLLQVAGDSLAQLRQDIKKKYGSQLRDALDKLGESSAVEPTPAPTPRADPPAAAAAAATATTPAPCPGPQFTSKAIMTYSKAASEIAGSIAAQAAGTAGGSCRAKLVLTRRK